MAPISAPPATTRRPAATVRRPIISLRPTTIAAKTTPHSDCVALSGETTVTRPCERPSTSIVYATPSVTEEDADRLRELGLSDAEIVSVVSAAAARCFFSKALDGLGVQPDAAYAELDPGLREALVVGRPIASR